MKKIWTLIIIIIVLATAGAAIWWKLSPKADRVKMQAAEIVNLRPMVELCTVDFYEDLPVKASIGRRHIFAKASVKGSISYDLEKISQRISGDTLYISLPKERIDVFESTDPDSYIVIDTWNEKFLGNSSFTTKEENRLKQLTIENFKKNVAERGYVEQARNDARRNLASMLTSVTGKTVIVD